MFSIRQRVLHKLFGQKLKSERNRLGLSQDALRKLVDTSVKTIVNWESDASAPNGKQLLIMYDLGFDIMLIITGKKVNGSLSDDETLLLEAFSSAPEILKQAAILVLNSANKNIQE